MQFVAWRGLSDDYRSKLVGHSPWTPADTHPAPVLVKDIDETDEPDWVKTAIKAEGIRALAFIPLVSRGRTIGKFMSYFPDVHEFHESEVELAVTIARQLGFGIERARADEERQRGIDGLRESEERFRLMSEQAPVMIWTSDAQGRCLHLNRLLREFWGVEDLLAFDWQRTMHPDDAAEIGRQMMQAISNRESVTIDGRYLNADGSYRILRTEARPRFSPTGTFLGMIGVNVDITERQEAERRLRLLLDELNHRVKNTLAVVQAMAHQSFRDGQADPVCVRAFEGRLIALATAHNLLTQSNWENAALDDVALGTLRSQGIDGHRYSVSGPPVILSAKQALAVSLALHELCTNALKYGALSNDAGSVELSWEKKQDPNPQLHINWQERGGPKVKPPARQGFGTRLIEQSLTYDLDAEVALQFRPEGVVCAIQMALP